MATANYLSQQGFPLYVYQSDDAVDEEFQYRFISEELVALNEKYNHVGVYTRGGYYSGFQIVFDIPNVYEKNNKKEVDKEVKLLLDDVKDIAYNYNMQEIRVVGRFSNGEVLYERVKTL
jgi:hypothetical protein